ncbi:MAG TPA: type II secretion system protein M [Steroidobacteraceae bacterium]|nr:type II secretion system protein M [Steroidobacteraceae bacterium]
MSASISARDRRVLAVGAIAGAVLLVLGVILPLDRSVAHAHQRLAQKRADLEWMQRVAPELAAAPAAPSSAGESLLVIVDRSARESGLASALAGSEPGGTGRLSLRLEKAPFDALIAWLARLAQQNGIRVESAIIDTAGAPGLVNAAVVLHAG